MRAFFTALLVLTLAPSGASALTVDQVIAMSKAGVTEAVILAFIERDRTIFSLEPEQMVTLKREGLSETVIIAMLHSGRAEGEEAARAESAYRNAMIAASLAPGPEVLIIGHGPDRPNAGRYDSHWSGQFFFPAAWPAVHTGAHEEPAYAAPRLVPRVDRRFLSRQGSIETQRVEPLMCYAQVQSGAARNPNPLTFVTECPAVMQPRRKSPR